MPVVRRRSARSDILPPHTSAGYLVRDAHRAFQRLLEQRIARHGVTRGQWYFLRVLWEEDGLSQRELSARTGMTEPTTVVALRGMARAGLTRTERAPEDRRRCVVRLTPKGRRMRERLLPVARGIVDEAARGVSARDLDVFRRVLRQMTANLDRLQD